MYKLLIISTIFFMGCGNCNPRYDKLKYRRGDIVRLRCNPGTDGVVVRRVNTLFATTDYIVSYTNKEGDVKRVYVYQEEIVNE